MPGEIKKSRDDWGYILKQNGKFVSRIWALPTESSPGRYDVYKWTAIKGELAIFYDGEKSGALKIKEGVLEAHVDEFMRHRLSGTPIQG